ncbi:MAG TPA: hypothetical protein VG448_07855 [Solirubrobacterales bacterium]|nr:hypothetical protein [Solirubrobacterales bacterium]
MKLTKILGVVAVAAMALMAFASTASATTLEVGGVAKNEAVTIKASLKENSALLTDTNNISANTCTTSTVEGKTSTFTGAAVEGPISALSWSNCTQGNPTVDAKGSLSVTNISGTTNGTVRSTGANVTVPSFFGNLTCTTSNTDLGTLNGKKEGSATMTINAVLSCTVIGTARWSGTYTVTSPSGLGVGA